MEQIIAYKTPENTVSIVVPTGELSIENVASKDVPPNTPYKILNRSEVPSDRTFRNAWEFNNGIQINMNKAKNIAHNIRRSRRAEEFNPYDEVIMKQIPGNDFTKAEEERQKIRDKYSKLQEDIDNAETPEELKELLGL